MSMKQQQSAVLLFLKTKQVKEICEKLGITNI